MNSLIGENLVCAKSILSDKPVRTHMHEALFGIDQLNRSVMNVNTNVIIYHSNLHYRGLSVHFWGPTHLFGRVRLVPLDAIFFY